MMLVLVHMSCVVEGLCWPEFLGLIVLKYGVESLVLFVVAFRAADSLF